MRFGEINTNGGAYKLPTADGSNTQVIKTAGNATTSFLAGAAGFGSWYTQDTQPANFDTSSIYQAPCDGFVLSTGAVSCYTDSNSSPSTLRGAVTSPRFFMMPVRKDDYWKVTGSASYIYWLPLGTGSCTHIS